MRKPRCNSTWNRLTRPQRETLELWLFEEHLGYDEILARLQSEFGVKASRSSLCHYYQRRSHERQAAELIEAQSMAVTVATPKSDTASMRAAGIKLIAKTALKIAFERPDRLKELESLTKLLLMNEDIEVRRSRVKLEQQQFYYQAASAASEELPKLAKLLLQIDEDDEITDAAKLAKVHDLLFPDQAGLDHNAKDTGARAKLESTPAKAAAEADLDAGRTSHED